MAYATYSDMEDRFDTNVLKDLVSDTGTAATTLSGNARIEAALADASGLINTALSVPASAYTIAELEGLTGDDLAYLKRLICGLAMGYLLGRRPEKYGADFKEITDRAHDVLLQIRKGELVFNVETSKTAGLPETGGMTHTEYQDLNLWRDRVKHFYPTRGLPRSRQN